MIAASTTTRSDAGRTRGRPVTLAPVGRETEDRPAGQNSVTKIEDEARPVTAGPGKVTAELIVLGRDASGKAHASWFGPTDAALGAKAADMMGMAALRVATDELRALAGKLPQGRVFASGRAFVPFVRASLFDELVRHAPEADRAPARQAASPSSSAGGSVTATAATGATVQGERPSDWAGIGVGHIVLASDAVDDGWWEAVVLKRNSEMLTLKWQAWPELGQFVRRVEHVALLHPGFDARQPRS